MKCNYWVVVLLLAGGSAQADSVVRPLSVSLSGSDAFFPASQIIDGSGLAAPLNTGDLLPAVSNHLFASPAADSWVSGAPGGFPSNWFDASPTDPVFVFDLGADHSLSSAHFWAYSGGTGVNDTFQGNSAQGISLRFNTEAQGTGGFAGPALTLSLDHGPLNEATPDYIIPRQDFAIGLQTARYVEMTVTSNWFQAPGDATGGGVARGGDRVGLGEVRFSFVPEPTTGLLGLLGAMTLAGGRRRRG